MEEFDIKNHIEKNDFDFSFLPVTKMLKTINEALNAVTYLDKEKHEHFRQVIERFTPPYRQMDEIYKDALSAVSGNPWAIRRFIDGLDLLGASMPVIELKNRDDVYGKHIKHQNDKPHEHSKIIPTDGPMIPSSKTIPVFAAGAVLVAAGLYKKELLTNTLMQVLRKFEDFGKIYRSSLNSFGNNSDKERFLSLLDGFGNIPNWQDIPNLSHAWDFNVPDWHIDCLNSTYQAVLDSRHPQPQNIYGPYIINNIIPHKICPPFMISIRGSNFGTTSGMIALRRTDKTEFEILPDTWSPTLITAMIQDPAEAVWLKIPVSAINVCGQIVETFVPGNVYEDFYSGPASINSLTVNGEASSSVYVEPGINFDIRAKISGANTVNIKIIESGNIIQSFNAVVPNPSLPDYNLSYTLPVSYNNRTTLVTVEVTAIGDCIPLIVTKRIEVISTKDPELLIEGIEVTQSVQHYKSGLHLTDPLTFGPDNSLGLVTGKAAWARVYINSLRDPQFDNGKFEGVTGVLVVESGGFPSITVLNPHQSSTAFIVHANPSYSARRGDINQTLNFIIPAHLMTGAVRLSVRLSSLTTVPFNIPAQFSLTLDPLNIQRLRLVFIPIGYNGPTSYMDNTPLVLPAPNLADLLITLGDTLAMYPVNSKPCIRVLPPHIISSPTLGYLFDASGNLVLESPGFPKQDLARLLAEINTIKNADGNLSDVIYLGLYALGTPSIAGTGGIANRLVAVSTVYDDGSPFQTYKYGKILGHEIGHTIGRGHAPCIDYPTDREIDYPSYPPYDDAMPFIEAVIGEFGLDIRNGRIHNPTLTSPQAFDFMSYCHREQDDYYHWVSPFGYKHAIANLPGKGLLTCSGGGGLTEKDPIPVIWLSGSFNLKGEIEISHIAEIQLTNKITGDILPLHAEILDTENKLLASVNLRESKNMACGCGGSDIATIDPLAGKQFNAYLPVSPKAASIRICKGYTVLWERTKFSVSPEIQITQCSINEKELLISWKSNCDTNAVPEFWLQWRSVADSKWKALVICKTENKTFVELQYLLTGDIEIRIIMQDGFSSATSNLFSITIPPGIPKVAIINPVNNMQVNAESAILLWGYAVDCHGQNLPDKAMTWYVNGKVIGTGTTLPFPMKLLVKKTTFNIELVAKDKYGSAKSSVVIRNEK